MCGFQIRAIHSVGASLGITFLYCISTRMEREKGGYGAATFVCGMLERSVSRMRRPAGFARFPSVTHSRTVMGTFYSSRAGAGDASIRWCSLEFPVFRRNSSKAVSHSPSRSFGGVTSKHRTSEKLTPIIISTESPITLMSYSRNLELLPFQLLLLS